jgi:predicted RND superfamily exporter protein
MPLTKWYKMLTGRLKQMPFLYVVPVAFLIVLVMYLVFGHLVVGLAGLLQYGS